MNQRAQDIDPRRRKTQETLQSAFIVLALKQRYDQIRVDDIVEVAGVGRSTFYEHFTGKQALLLASMDAPLSLLAGLPLGESDMAGITGLLEHFWANRDLAGSLFQGASLRVIRNALVARIETRLKRRDGARPRFPHRLAAHALADAMLSPILAWLAGEAPCSTGALAATLTASSRSLLSSLTMARP